MKARRLKLSFVSLILQYYTCASMSRAPLKSLSFSGRLLAVKAGALGNIRPNRGTAKEIDEYHRLSLAFRSRCRVFISEWRTWNFMSEANLTIADSNEGNRLAITIWNKTFTIKYRSLRTVDKVLHAAKVKETEEAEGSVPRPIDVFPFFIFKLRALHRLTSEQWRNVRGWIKLT